MQYDIIEDIQTWNDDRGNYEYNNRLEYDMLQEEVDEYFEACMNEDTVDQADALADIIVVAVGSLYKLCGNDKIKFEDIMLAVTAANNTKGKEKNTEGKITKPKDFVGPEDMIAKVLFYEN